MSVHYNYFQHIIPHDIVHAQDWQKLLTAVLLGIALVVLGRRASRRVLAPAGLDAAVIPEQKLSGTSFFDFFVESFVKYHDSVLGEQNRKYVSFTGSLFLFIFAANLVGLIPGVPALTTTVWVNVAMAIVVFVYFNYLGIKEHGVGGYLKHFCGPVIFLVPLFFPLEIFSTVLRVLTLNLRLYWNISADHLVLETVTGLIGPIIPIALLVLGAFICFMQAFIFTTLTMVYILLATQHEEEAGH